MPKGQWSFVSPQTAQCMKYTCCIRIKTTWPFLGLLNRQVFHSQGSALLEEYFTLGLVAWNIQCWSEMCGGLCIFICRFWKGVKLTTPFQHQPINAVQADVVFNPAPVIPSMCRILSTLELGQEYFCVCFLKCQWLFCSYSSLLAVQTHLLKIKVSQRL